MSGGGWNPTQIRRVIRVHSTSTSPALVETDQGLAFAKARGNAEGTHTLACDWIGCQLAALLGLFVPEVAIVDLGASVCWRMLVASGEGEKVLPGPAFLSRMVDDVFAWDGSVELLQEADNLSHVAGLIAIDTWLRNNDRCSPDRTKQNLGNVVFCPGEGSKSRILTIDFSHCISQGHSPSKSALGIEATRDERVYGCFPAFRQVVDEEQLGRFAREMRRIKKREITNVLKQVPRAWKIPAKAHEMLPRFLSGRQDHVSATLVDLVMKTKWELTND